jgi:hypothetical protein
MRFCIPHSLQLPTMREVLCRYILREMTIHPLKAAGQ